MSAIERLQRWEKFLGPELSKEYSGFLRELEAAADAERRA